jgi:hypothetical protein
MVNFSVETGCVISTSPHHSVLLFLCGIGPTQSFSIWFYSDLVVSSPLQLVPLLIENMFYDKILS